MTKIVGSSFNISVAPEAGADATTYWLSPSVTQVKRTATGTHIPEYVTCTSMAKTGDESPVSGIGTIRFIILYKSGSSSAESIYSSNIVVTSDMAAISFRLYLGAVKMDEKTVLVVEDGEKGDQGRAGRMPFPSGVWDIERTFTATDDVAPVVLYDPGNMYYVMNKSVTVTGLNPATDYAENGTNATWLPFESYQAIFTNILMANFAKLASGVFLGNHMFSQYGKDVNGNDVNSYELFDPTKIGQSDAPFTPNALVDWLTGTMRLLKLIATGAEISGKIEADSGNIGGFEIGSGRLGISSLDPDGDPVNNNNGMFLYENMIGFNSTLRQAIIGTLSSLGTEFLGRFTNTKSDVLPNYGLIFDIRNSQASNRAIIGNGDCVLNGAVIGYGFEELSFTENDKYIELRKIKSTIIYVYFNHVNCEIILPSLSKMCGILGISYTIPFAVELTIVCTEGTGYFRGRNTSNSGQNTNYYPQLKDWNGDISNGYQISHGDCWKVALFYQGGATSYTNVPSDSAYRALITSRSY